MWRDNLLYMKQLNLFESFEFFSRCCCCCFCWWCWIYLYFFFWSRMNDREIIKKKKRDTHTHTHTDDEWNGMKWQCILCVCVWCIQLNFFFLFFLLKLNLKLATFFCALWFSVPCCCCCCCSDGDSYCQHSPFDFCFVLSLFVCLLSNNNNNNDDDRIIEKICINENNGLGKKFKLKWYWIVCLFVLFFFMDW